MTTTRWVAIVAAIVAVALVVIGKVSPNPAIAVLTSLGVVSCVLAVVAIFRVRR